jgi:hypothetical protein
MSKDVLHIWQLDERINMIITFTSAWEINQIRRGAVRPLSGKAGEPGFVL